MHTKAAEAPTQGKPFFLPGTGSNTSTLLGASPHSSGRRNSFLLKVVWDVIPRTLTAILLQPKDKAGSRCEEHTKAEWGMLYQAHPVVCGTSEFPIYFLRLGLVELGFQFSAAEKHSDESTPVKYYKRNRMPWASLMVKNPDKAACEETRPTVQTCFVQRTDPVVFPVLTTTFICTFPKAFWISQSQWPTRGNVEHYFNQGGQQRPSQEVTRMSFPAKTMGD